MGGVVKKIGEFIGNIVESIVEFVGDIITIWYARYARSTTSRSGGTRCYN